MPRIEEGMGPVRARHRAGEDPEVQEAVAATRGIAAEAIAGASMITGEEERIRSSCLPPRIVVLYRGGVCQRCDEGEGRK